MDVMERFVLFVGKFQGYSSRNISACSRNFAPNARVDECTRLARIMDMIYDLKAHCVITVRLNLKIFCSICCKNDGRQGWKNTLGKIR